MLGPVAYVEKTFLEKIPKFLVFAPKFENALKEFVNGEFETFYHKFSMS